MLGKFDKPEVTLKIRLELNSSEEEIWYSGDTAATHQLSDLCLEYDAIFGKFLATTASYLNSETALIPYTKINPLPDTV